MSTASWRRFDAYCTNAIEPTTMTIQNASARRVRGHFDSGSGSMLLVIGSRPAYGGRISRELCAGARLLEGRPLVSVCAGGETACRAGAGEVAEWLTAAAC